MIYCMQIKQYFNLPSICNVFFVFKSNLSDFYSLLLTCSVLHSWAEVLKSRQWYFVHLIITVNRPAKPVFWSGVLLHVDSLYKTLSGVDHIVWMWPDQVLLICRLLWPFQWGFLVVVPLCLYIGYCNWNLRSFIVCYSSILFSVPHENTPI